MCECDCITVTGSVCVCVWLYMYPCHLTPNMFGVQARVVYMCVIPFMPCVMRVGPVLHVFSVGGCMAVLLCQLGMCNTASLRSSLLAHTTSLLRLTLKFALVY